MVNDQVRAYEFQKYNVLFDSRFLRARGLYNEDCCRWHFFDLSQVSDMQALYPPRNTVFICWDAGTSRSDGFKAVKLQQLVCAMAV